MHMKNKLLSFLGAALFAGAAWAGSSTGTADVLSDLIAASGSYLDSSGNGTNWSVSTAPGFNASAYSGQPAWVFDGATSTPLIAAQNYYGSTPFNFTPPIGDWSAVFIVDLNSSTSTSDGHFHLLVGSGLTGVGQWGFGQVNRQLYFAGAGCESQNTWTGTVVYGGSNTNLTVTQPHVVALAYSNTDQAVSICVDGCAAGWQSYSISGQIGNASPSSASTDGTMWAGMSNATSSCGLTPYPWYGDFYRVTLYRETLSTAGKATRWASILASRRAQYGTP